MADILRLAAGALLVLVIQPREPDGACDRVRTRRPQTMQMPWLASGTVSARRGMTCRRSMYPATV